MATRVRSYAKINLGLAIGPVRPDRFHGLATLYQTLALHDWVTVEAKRVAGAGSSRIMLTTNHPRVPTDSRNTAWKMVERALERMGVGAEVTIHIEKGLPVQGGMGAGSANAAAALIGLERELDAALPGAERLEIAAGVGSDVPLFLVGGAVLGTGRGEEVHAMRDFPATPCVVAVPEVGVSTPLAFRDWDAKYAARQANESLTAEPGAGILEQLSRVYTSVLGVWNPCHDTDAELHTSGIVGGSGWGRSETGPAPQSNFPELPVEGVSERGTRNGLAEDALLALVRTGIENDFEEVVFPQYPLLREIKRELMGVDSGAPALYAALSGSGSALFGLYRSQADAEAAQRRVQASGCKAFLTESLPRSQYWRKMFAE